MSALFYYDPFYDFNRLFNESFDARFLPAYSSLQHHDQLMRPRMDLRENTKANTLTVSFELPGISKEDVHISAYDGRLRIAGETKISDDHQDSAYIVKERRYGKFSRTLQLPNGVRDDQVDAKMENGVLTITFPKMSESDSKEISVA